MLYGISYVVWRLFSFPPISSVLWNSRFWKEFYFFSNLKKILLNIWIDCFFSKIKEISMLFVFFYSDKVFQTIYDWVWTGKTSEFRQCSPSLLTGKIFWQNYLIKLYNRFYSFVIALKFGQLNRLPLISLLGYRVARRVRR